MLRWFTKKLLSRFHEDESGPTAVEYAVMIALIIVVCISAVQSLSTATRSSLDASSNAIQSVL
jgi:pilus assembly protein Flp/PilA